MVYSVAHCHDCRDKRPRRRCLRRVRGAFPHGVDVDADVGISLRLSLTPLLLLLFLVCCVSHTMIPTVTVTTATHISTSGSSDDPSSPSSPEPQPQRQLATEPGSGAGGAGAAGDESVAKTPVFDADDAPLRTEFEHTFRDQALDDLLNPTAAAPTTTPGATVTPNSIVDPFDAVELSDYGEKWKELFTLSGRIGKTEAERWLDTHGKKGSTFGELVRVFDERISMRNARTAIGRRWAEILNRGSNAAETGLDMSSLLDGTGLRFADFVTGGSGGSGGAGTPPNGPTTVGSGSVPNAPNTGGGSGSVANGRKAVEEFVRSFQNIMDVLALYGGDKVQINTHKRLFDALLADIHKYDQLVGELENIKAAYASGTDAADEIYILLRDSASLFNSICERLDDASALFSRITFQTQRGAKGVTYSLIRVLDLNVKKWNTRSATFARDLDTILQSVLKTVKTTGSGSAGAVSSAVIDNLEKMSDETRAMLSARKSYLPPELDGFTQTVRKIERYVSTYLGDGQDTRHAANSAAGDTFTSLLQRAQRHIGTWSEIRTRNTKLLVQDFIDSERRIGDLTTLMEELKKFKYAPDMKQRMTDLKRLLQVLPNPPSSDPVNFGVYRTQLLDDLFDDMKMFDGIVDSLDVMTKYVNAPKDWSISAVQARELFQSLAVLDHTVAYRFQQIDRFVQSLDLPGNKKITGGLPNARDFFTTSEVFLEYVLRFYADVPRFNIASKLMVGKNPLLDATMSRIFQRRLSSLHTFERGADGTARFFSILHRSSASGSAAGETILDFVKHIMMRMPVVEEWMTISGAADDAHVRTFQDVVLKSGESLDSYLADIRYALNTAVVSGENVPKMLDDYAESMRQCINVVDAMIIDPRLKDARHSLASSTAAMLNSVLGSITQSLPLKYGGNAQRLNLVQNGIPRPLMELIVRQVSKHMDNADFVPHPAQVQALIDFEKHTNALISSGQYENLSFLKGKMADLSTLIGTLKSKARPTARVTADVQRVSDVIAAMGRRSQGAVEALIVLTEACGIALRRVPPKGSGSTGGSFIQVHNTPKPPCLNADVQSTIETLLKHGDLDKENAERLAKIQSELPDQLKKLAELAKSSTNTDEIKDLTEAVVESLEFTVDVANEQQGLPPVSATATATATSTAASSTSGPGDVTPSSSASSSRTGTAADEAADALDTVGDAVKAADRARDANRAASLATRVAGVWSRSKSAIARAASRASKLVPAPVRAVLGTVGKGLSYAFRGLFLAFDALDISSIRHEAWIKAHCRLYMCLREQDRNRNCPYVFLNYEHEGTSNHIIAKHGGRQSCSTIPQHCYDEYAEWSKRCGSNPLQKWTNPVSWMYDCSVRYPASECIKRVETCSTINSAVPTCMASWKGCADECTKWSRRFDDGFFWQLQNIGYDW
jgi:hypothetical protein